MRLGRSNVSTVRKSGLYSKIALKELQQVAQVCRTSLGLALATRALLHVIYLAACWMRTAADQLRMTR